MVATSDFLLAGTLFPSAWSWVCPSYRESRPGSIRRFLRHVVSARADVRRGRRRHRSRRHRKQLAAALSGVTDRAPSRPAPDAAKSPRPPECMYSTSPSRRCPPLSSPSPLSHRLSAIPTLPPTAEKSPRDLATAIVNLRLSILAKKERRVQRRVHRCSRADQFYRQAPSVSSARPINGRRPRHRRAGVASRLAARIPTCRAEGGRRHGTQCLGAGGEDRRHARSDALAGKIAQSLLDREVFTTPADDLALVKPALEKITVADCVAALRDTWAANHRYVIVSGTAKIDATPPLSSPRRTRNLSPSPSHHQSPRPTTPGPTPNSAHPARS